MPKLKDHSLSADGFYQQTWTTYEYLFTPFYVVACFCRAD